MKFEWDLTHLCKNEEEAISLEKEEKARLDEFLSIYESALDSEDTFQEVLEKHLKIGEIIERVYCYYKRHVDLNRNNRIMVDHFNRAVSLYQETEKVKQKYIDFLYEKQELVGKFLTSKKLSSHTLYIERLLERKESEISQEIIDEETRLEQFHKTVPLTYRHIMEEDISYLEVENEKGEMCKAKNTFITQNREVRKNSYEAVCLARKPFHYVLGTLLDTKVSYVSTISRLEGFASPLVKVLKEDEMPVDFVDHLLEIIKDNVCLYHKYLKALKSYLNVEKLYPYDLCYPMNEEKRVYKIEEAIDIIKTALAPFGDEHVRIIDKAFEEGWIDLYPKEGKRKGSVSMVTYAGVPYLFVNYKEDFYSLRSLCHELGHSIHSYYAKKQHYEYFEYNLFVAEISSMVNEEFLFDYVLKHAEEKDYLTLAKNRLSSYLHSLFSQSILTGFEKDIYDYKKDGKILDATTLGECYLKNMRIFYGDEVELSLQDGYEWISVSHFFENQPFYMWKYTADRLIAIYLFKRMKEDHHFIQKYKEFLAKGNSMRTKELLKLIDVDLENPTFIKDALIYVEEVIDDFISKLKKD